MNKVIIKKPNEYGSLDSEELKAFEHENGILLPEDYMDFLRKNNGGRPIFELSGNKKMVDWFYGFHEGPPWATIYHAIDVYHKRVPSWYFPIACDPFGNQYLMSLYEENYGLIAFWDHENETKGDADQYFDNMEILADSFTDFLNEMF